MNIYIFACMKLGQINEKTEKAMGIACFVVLFLVCKTGDIQGQFHKKGNFSGSFVQGFISDQEQQYRLTVDSYISGLSLSYSKYTSGSKQWHHDYRFP
jgi:hypothetical protein